MPTFPNGSGVLLCPVGPQFSMVSDDFFDTIQAATVEGDGVIVLRAIPPKVFAAWYSNAKQIRRTLTFFAEGDDDFVFLDNVVYSQWLGNYSDGFTKNTGDHPLPLMFFEWEGDKVLSSKLSGDLSISDFWQYYSSYFEDDGTETPDSPLNYGYFFVHRDKFYYLNFLFSGDVGNDIQLFIDEKTIKLEFKVGSEFDGSDASVEDVYEIIDYFYPVS